MDAAGAEPAAAVEESCLLLLLLFVVERPLKTLKCCFVESIVPSERALVGCCGDRPPDEPLLLLLFSPLLFTNVGESICSITY